MVLPNTKLTVMKKKEYKVLGIADETMAMRATLYDFTKKGTLTPGNSVIILNYIFKTEPSEGIVITKNSKVIKNR